MFLGGSPAFLQQIQVHECRFKFLPICLSSILLCSSQLTCSASLFFLKKNPKQQVSRNVPFSKHDFLGFSLQKPHLSAFDLLCEERWNLMWWSMIYIFSLWRSSEFLKWFCIPEAQRRLWLIRIPACLGFITLQSLALLFESQDTGSGYGKATLLK